MIVSRPLTNTESERVGTVRAWTLMEADRGIEPDFHGASSKHRFANWVTDHNPHLLAIHADDDVARVDRVGHGRGHFAVRREELLSPEILTPAERHVYTSDRKDQNGRGDRTRQPPHRVLTNILASR